MPLNPLTFEEFAAFLEKGLQGAKKPSIAVGVSGGSDSLSLVLLAKEWIHQHGGNLTALTVDHGLRKESSAEAEHIASFMKEREIPHHILKWEGEKPGSHIQEKARLARYDLLIKWCREQNYPYLLLGHHQGDQVETFLMRLMAGSGLDGLAAMRWVRVIQGISVIRPFLKVPPERLQAFLKTQHVTWIEDPSNKDMRFLRTRIRQLLSEQPQLAKRLPLVIQKLREDHDFISLMVEKEWAARIHCSSVGFATFAVDSLLKLHATLRKRLLARLINTIGGGGYPPSAHQIDQLELLLRREHLKPFTSGGCYWIQRQGQMHVQRELSAIHDVIPVEQMNEDTLWDNRFWVKKELRKYLSSTSFIACVGRDIVPQLKAKLGSKIKLPSLVWPTLPAIWDQGRVVAIPYLGYSSLENEINFNDFFLFKPSFIIV